MLMYLDGEMPVVVLEYGVDGTARILHEDTGRAWWVDGTRIDSQQREKAASSEIPRVCRPVGGAGETGKNGGPKQLPTI